MAVVDHVGREITPGCSIIYPVRRGSEMKLNRITVEQLGPKLTGFNANGIRVFIQNIGNVIVVVPPEPPHETIA